MQYTNAMLHFIGKNPVELSSTQKMDKAKLEREEAINPIKTIAMDEGLDPFTYIGTPLSKGAKIARFAKDFAKNAPITGALHALKHGGDENYKLKDSLIAGGIGGTIGGVVGTIFGKAIPKGALDNLSPSILKGEEELISSLNKGIIPAGEKTPNQQLIIDEYTKNALKKISENNPKANTLNSNPTDDEIASKIAQARFGNDAVNVTQEAINKSPQDMSTQELFSNIFENIKKQNPKLNDESLRAKALEDINSKSQIAQDELLSAKLSKNHIDEFINTNIGNENISKEQRELIHTLHETGLVDDLSTSKLKSNIAGNYDVNSKTISLNENSNILPEQKAQGLIHEYVHSSTENLLRNNPRFNAEISLIHSQAKKSFEALGKNIEQYGFTKPSEFIAEAFSNQIFAKELNSVKVSAKIKKKLGLGEYVNTLWDAIYSKFANVISKFSGKEFKLNKDSYYYALQNSINKHRNDVDAIKDNILSNKGLRDEVLNIRGNNSKVLSKENVQTLNSISKVDKQESINALENLRNEIEYNKLSKEEQDIYDVYLGKRSVADIKSNDLKDIILLEKGTKRTGARKIIVKHGGD